MFVYTPNRPGTCERATGIVKLDVKPQHGRAAHHLTAAYIPVISRFTHRPTGCPPDPTTGFAIIYSQIPVITAPIHSPWTSISRNVAYYGIPLQTKLEYGAAYLGLAALLAVMTYDVHEMLGRTVSPA